MPWAQSAPSLEESELVCRRAQARFRLREDLALSMFERAADGSEGRYLGGSGLHRILWDVRRFEIGYWCRSGCAGQGFITEAVRALNRFAFDRLDARRVEVRMDGRNERSRRVAERAGFTFEGVLRGDSLTPQGEVRDMRLRTRAGDRGTRCAHRVETRTPRGARRSWGPFVRRGATAQRGRRRRAMKPTAARPPNISA